MDERHKHPAHTDRSAGHIHRSEHVTGSGGLRHSVRHRVCPDRLGHTNSLQRARRHPPPGGVRVLRGGHLHLPAVHRHGDGVRHVHHHDLLRGHLRRPGLRRDLPRGDLPGRPWPVGGGCECGVGGRLAGGRGALYGLRAEVVECGLWWSGGVGVISGD